MPTLVMANHVNIFFSAFQISKEWTFGSELCEMWTMSDVLCCTASILHLLAIAVDRLEAKLIGLRHGQDLMYRYLNHSCNCDTIVVLF